MKKSMILASYLLIKEISLNKIHPFGSISGAMPFGYCTLRCGGFIAPYRVTEVYGNYNGMGLNAKTSDGDSVGVTGKVGLGLGASAGVQTCVNAKNCM